MKNEQITKKEQKKETLKKAAMAKDNYEVKKTVEVLMDALGQYLGGEIGEDMMILVAKVSVEKMMLFSSKTTFELLSSIGLM